MSAVRKLNYEAYELPLVDQEVNYRKKVAYQAQPIRQRILATIAIICVIAFLSSVCVLFITRYVEVSKMQYDIFQTKQEISRLKIQRDELIGIKELSMVMEDVRDYAMANLDMIEVDSSHQVIITTSETYTLSPEISMKSLPKFSKADDDKGKLYYIGLKLKEAFDFD
ncbi:MULTISPECIES: hypothetical protein [unclassified Fusibacter]|uniref:hypothetical protein n=1 Tax=unclassified Fusibacter TaxID=2624464 RepID=UPI0010128F02|nr:MULTISPECIES: hypothetical protein [unclassified Fusibacter]MCK8061323.1 hypothetical protein [Fusibacter sp. A2]NPE23480.1 hypothetical protein [Fusibacter sp. A1]RXV59086.1 hypothetical protein DWB64_16815 [Fusibacter sp. A1]